MIEFCSPRTALSLSVTWDIDVECTCREKVHRSASLSEGIGSAFLTVASRPFPCKRFISATSIARKFPKTAFGLQGWAHRVGRSTWSSKQHDIQSISFFGGRYTRFHLSFELPKRTSPNSKRHQHDSFIISYNPKASVLITVIISFDLLCHSC